MSKNTNKVKKEKVIVHIKYVQILILYVLALAFLSTTTQAIITLDNSGGAYAWNGTYTQTIDGLVNTSWKMMSWTQVNGSGGEFDSGNSTVGIWHLNGESTTFTDSSGLGNTGTATGALDCTNDQGKYGTGCTFDGTMTGINIDTVSNDFDPRITNDFTILLWANASGNTANQECFFGTGRGSSAQLWACFDWTGTIMFLYDNSLGPSISNAGYRGGWHQYVFSRNGTTYSIFVDGVYRTHGNRAQTVYTIGSYRIGSTGYSGSDYYFNGSIDEFVIYNRSLTPAEISQAYAVGKIKLRHRLSNDNLTWSNWSNYSTSYQNTTINQSARYFQYQTLLQTFDNISTPILYNVTIEKDMPLSGWINITIGSYTQACMGYSFCNMQFLFGTGQLGGGNYTVLVEGHNESAYFDKSNSSYNYYFEEQAATANMQGGYVQIWGMGVVPYSYLFNVTLNNSASSTMFNQTIQLKSAGYGMTASIVNTTCAVGTLWSWTNITTASSPSARYSSGYAFDSDNNLTIVSAGWSQAGQLADTWIYNASATEWTNMNTGFGPITYHTMAYDSFNKAAISFGGGISGVGVVDYTMRYNVSNNLWTNMAPSTKPSGRQNAAIVYDTKNKVFILFGGTVGSSETWSYNLSNNAWTNMAPTNSPGGRSSHAMAYDQESNLTIMFGGGSGSSETWIYNYSLNNWTNTSPISSPSARFNHRMDYDPQLKQVIIFGGGSYLSDVWTYNVSSNYWRQITPVGSIAGRINSVMSYDPIKKTHLIFGGSGLSSTYLNDTAHLKYSIDYTYSPISTLSYSTNCTTEFNITVQPNVSVGGIYSLTWNATWMNRNGTRSTTEKVTQIEIMGNPQFTINTTSINQTENISLPLRTNILIDNNGNVPLVLNINYTGQGVNPMPARWITFLGKDHYGGTDAEWDQANNKWTNADYGYTKTLVVNLTVTNYTQGTYTGLINITGTYAAQIYYLEINVSTTIYSNMSISTNYILIDANLSSQLNRTITISDIGNAPLTNVTVNITGINSSWFNFTASGMINNTWNLIIEGTQSIMSILFNLGNFMRNTYNGVINITTTEGVYHEINITIDVNPNGTTNITSIHRLVPHDSQDDIYFGINSTGNVKMTNVNITYVPADLPSSWITKVYPNFTSQILENNMLGVNVKLYVPLAQAPGNYSGLIYVNSSNVPTSIINLTVEVPTDNSWSSSPDTTYNITKTFVLNERGDVGNITIYNPGNIDKNFSLAYAQDQGIVTVVPDGGVVECAGANPNFTSISKQGYSTIRVCHKGWSGNVVDNIITITISEPNSVPSPIDLYMIMNVTNTPPVITKNETRTTDMTVQRYNELNESMVVWVEAADDESNGINKNSVVINVTRPGGATTSYGNTQVSSQTIPPGTIYQNKVRFNITYNETGEAGNYSVWFYVEDGTAQITNTTFRFEIFNLTNMTVSSAGLSVSGVTKTTGVNTSINITLSNLGLTAAYEINITGNFTKENFTYTPIYLDNQTKNSSMTLLINISVPARALGTYNFTPNIRWKNRGGSYTNITQRPIAVTVLSNPDFILTPDSQNLDLGQGEAITNKFIITPVGNDNVTGFSVSTTSQSNNLTIAYAPSGGNINIDIAQNITTNISVARYIVAGIRSFITQVGAGSIFRSFETNITTAVNTSWNVSRNNITINAVSGQFGVNNQTLVHHVGTSGVLFDFRFRLSGDITNVSRIETSPKFGIFADQEFAVALNYTAPQNNNVFLGLLIINDTVYNTIQTVNITFNSYFYDMHVLTIESPAEIVENDTINESVEIAFGGGYISENVTYSMYVNDTLCPIIDSYDIENVTYLSCKAPYKADARTYDLKTIANYSSPTGEVLVIIQNRSTLYYKDLAAPVMIYHQENDTELGDNITILANATDNLALGGIDMEIADPNGAKTNYSLYSADGLYKQSLNFTLGGIYTIRYMAYDGTGNRNESTTGSFEIYEDKNYAGTLEDQTGNPFVVNFTLTNLVSGNATGFTTDAQGAFNVTIKTRVYDLSMNFDNYKINLSNVNFFRLDTNIMDMDRLSASDISGELIGGKTGFSVQTDMATGGYIYIDYNNLTINSKDNLRVYSCQDYNYTTRKCGSTWWIQLPSTNNKITNLITCYFESFSNTSSAFALAEVEPSPGPIMSLPALSAEFTARHNQVNNYTFEVDSIGQSSLQNIRATCTSGSICTNMTLNSSIITALLPGARGYLELNFTVPAGTVPGNYTGVFSIEANSVTDQDITGRVEVLSDKRFTYSFSNAGVTVGSNVEGSIGNITVVNNGNTLQNILFESGALTIANITSLAPQQSISRTIGYRAPKTIGLNNYEINITDSTIKNTTSVAINVTRVVNVTSTSGISNLVAGGSIIIDATANYQGTFGGANWSVDVDGSACTITSSSANSMTCTLPAMSARITHNMSVRGDFMGGHAYDIIFINYSDVFGPEIISYNDSAINTGFSTDVNATTYDDNGLNESSTASFVSPTGTIIPATISVLGNTISARASLSELGDYSLNYILRDNLGNQRAVSELFEFYEERNFEGSTRNVLGQGMRTGFTLYRNGTNTILHEFNSTDDGNYSATIHKRRYDIGIATENVSIRLNDVDITTLNDPIQIDNVPLNLVSIPNAKDYTIFGFESQINSTGTIVISMNYNSQEINNINNIYVYKCPSWDFTNRECLTNWTPQNGSRGSNTISANISSFSAYAVAESNLEIPPNTIIYNTYSTQTTSSGSSGGGGGGSTVAGISISEMTQLIDDLKLEIFGQTEAITEKVEEISEKTKDVAVDTSQITRQLYSGENSKTKLHIKNDKNETIQIIAQIGGEVSDFVNIKNPIIELGKGEEADFEVSVNVPTDTTPGIYSGEIKLMMGNKVVSKIPTEIRVLESKDQLLDLKVQPITESTTPGKPARVQVDVYNLGKSKRVDIQLKLELVDPELDQVISEMEESIAVETTISVIKTLPVPEKTPLGRYLVRGTSYYTNNNKSMHAQSLAYLKVENPWYKRDLFGVVPVWMILLAIAFVALSITSFEIYDRIQKKRKKYQIQVDLKELPQPNERTGFIGNVAETNIRTFMDLDKLQTHTIIAGATGGGKSVAAQVMIEEALRKNIAVIVFDPTAQWTGFLRRSKEKVMLKQYKYFDMKLSEARAFNGNVHPVNNALEIIDIKRYINPGEINIFSINRLDPKDIDIFVANTIKEVFHANFAESQELKLLLVYDEVHRLLPKFGGSGEGFVQIERACREFRKWGVGLVLISQVLSDFVGSIKANIGTEIQMRTRDEGDLERIKTKYGEDILKSIVKASVGVGMLENAEYNKGRAYFIGFRPLLHSISRLSDEELASYNKYNEQIEDLDYQLEQLEKEGIDVFDLKLELKLALDKVKSGGFNMVDIYIESLQPRVDAIWKQIGKIPKKKTMKLANIEEIKKEIEKAKKEREKIVITSDGIKNMNTDASETNKDSKEDQARRYIDAQLSRKVPKSKIKSSLLAHGWSESKLNELLGIESQEQDPKRSMPKEEINIVKIEDAPPVQKKTAKTAEKPAERLERTATAVKSAQKTMPQDMSHDDATERFNRIKERMADMKQKGKDVSLIEIKMISIPSDLHIAALTKDMSDLKRVGEKLDNIEKELKGI